SIATVSWSIRALFWLLRGKALAMRRCPAQYFSPSLSLSLPLSLSLSLSLSFLLPSLFSPLSFSPLSFFSPPPPFPFSPPLSPPLSIVHAVRGRLPTFFNPVIFSRLNVDAAKAHSTKPQRSARHHQVINALCFGVSVNKHSQ